eukprot:COSAG06_NODE_38959_length_417_cov_9.811321_1_plen_46_part_10
MAAAAAPVPPAAAALSDAQVDSFVERGYLELPDAVPPALCARWVAA